MAQYLQYAAGSFIAGIIIARLTGLPDWSFLTFFVIGSAACIISVILSVLKKPFVLAVVTAFSLLGIADTIFHLDTSASTHLFQVINNGYCDFGARIVGHIDSSPDIRERYTIVSLRVMSVQSASGIIQKVERGNLYVKVYPSLMDDYTRLNYGNTIAITDAAVRLPEPAANPGGFDMKSFLNNQQFYGIVSIRDPSQLEILGEGGNPVVHTALSIKKHLLRSIKATVPYPESSFLGGVLLGLRSGLSQDVKDTFRAAGVSHVLAVSGLHVTIITLFFMGLFTLIKLPRTSAFIIIVIALLLFVLITGARPSTIRAAIMNTVTLIFFYFRGLKLDRSFLLGISVAALVILAFNPLILTEAAFLFSFSAVLSLSLLTRPIWDLANRYLYGFFRIFLFLEMLFCIGIVLINPRLMWMKWQWTAMALMILAAGFMADRLLPKTIAFRHLPGWISVFIAAQLSIQLGMLPLTAYYFKKVSVTAIFANFIAIPLIGVIVQLGLFAGILFYIPFIGKFLALALNATNWLAIKLFLGSAAFFGTAFPYPDIPPPTLAIMLPYYLALLALALFPWIQFHLIPRMRLLVNHRNHISVKWRLVVTALLLLIIIGTSAYSWMHKSRDLQITFLDPSLFGMGGGNSILIQTPSGKAFLVDAGPRHLAFGDKEISLDIGSNVITPALLAMHGRTIDTLVISCPNPNFSGGLVSIAANPSFNIHRFCHPLPFNELDTDASPETILMKLEDPSLFHSSSTLAWEIRDLFHAVQSREIASSPVSEGMTLYRESTVMAGKTQSLVIDVLNPPKERFQGRYASSSNSMVLRITYGKFSALLTSNADKRALAVLEQYGNIHATLLQVPANGQTFATTDTFTEAVTPLITVLSPLMNRWKLKDAENSLYGYRQIGSKTFSTHEDGAVIIRTDGDTVRIRGYASDRSEVLTL
ncbi:ComEC/Rec2 family competence protein [bacterium]|nr:ComEC/Rec2 family competence protein [candidate division CSSED10-310 bacterium]